ncbi:fibrinogen-like YCDxxxxGGGW domain-containing protein [Rothia nasimurium]|uniref:fibrinogen-like YCDxxxxGGGW domain-containing protein n=1 Tax=Rothia nasimurium TaxID=85336 RepID=UPI001F2D31C3|nr:fibrinogen-like YCDxxxxGGGW domain-containing protein [Rothia nasimurium]
MEHKDTSARPSKRTTARDFWVATRTQFKAPFSLKKPNLATKAGVGVLALATAVTVLPGATASDTYTPDGKTSETAAASCWEAKQTDPAATSGTYWLWTPEMAAPEQFYCDQETDGGGWVMIGRGRDGWEENYNGKGKASELYTNPDGTDAFTPVQLPSTTVDALIGNSKVSDLKEGFRIRRAANAEGTKWQNVTATRANATDWTWALSGTQTWRDIKFRGDSPTVTSSNRNFSSLTGQMMKPVLSMYQVNFLGTSAQGWRMGFAYGPVARGSDNATTHLWSKTGASPLPFSQVFLRPKLTQADLNLSDYADAGASGSTRRALPNSYSAKVTWRTSDTTGTGTLGELNTYVQAITQVGNTVFTGGDFAWVENAATGEKVQQKFLAGYDVTTGELVRTFMPTFNGQIKALEALPNGTLAVGGEFTEVNGEKVAGLVILNPVTGEIDRTYNFGIENRGAGSITSARTLDVQGDYLYVGGAFSHVVNTETGATGYSRNAGRFSFSQNGPDANWRPYLNGTVNGLSAADDGATVAAAGYFSEVNGTKTWKLAQLNTTDGNIAKAWTWEPSFPTIQRQGYQNDVEDAGATVWAAGSEHIIHQYAKNTMSRLYSAITIEGGDFQDLYEDQNNKVIYGACHCGNYIYEGSGTWMQPWTNKGFFNLQAIRLSAAFDAETGRVIGEFAPNLRGPRGDGVWEQFVDSTGTLWLGGDINRSQGANGMQQTVGFARFAPRDVTAPAAPRSLAVSTDGTTDVLTWPSAGRNVTYQVLRDNRVIATTTDTTYSVAHTDDARYFVRSADAAGNFSASTPVAVAQKTEQPVAPVEPTAQPTAEVTAEPTPTAEASAEPTAEATTEAPAPVEPPVVEEPAPAEPERLAEAPANGTVINNPAPIEPFAVPAENSEPVLASGDEWKIAFGLNAWQGLDSTWRATDYKYDTAKWYTTYSSVGWGEPRVATMYQFSSRAQPVSMMLRKELNLNLAAGQKLVLTTYVDDGMMIWVNGKEYTRQNLIWGALPTYTATRAVDFGAARTTPLVIEIPASDLKQGKNSIAVMVNSNTKGAATTFDMIGEVR